MKPTIWKFEVQVDDEKIIEMPAGAEILTVQTQGLNPCVWAKVDPEAPKVQRTFRWRGTGHPADNLGAYVGTVQHLGGDLIFHLFVDKE